jgi:UDPglucose--hexose-1-phosphate uridylyltransferase
MKETIRFERHIQKASFHNPMHGMSLDTQEIEIRRDPLSGQQSVLNPALEGKAAVVYGPRDTALIERLAEESRSRCILCGNAWETLTPKYPDEVVPGGRIRVGECVLFPNLFPVAQVHAVIRVGSRHFRSLREFDPATIAEALQCAFALTERVYRSAREVRFFAVAANYLGPAGASMVHPHFQVVGGDLPFSYQETVGLLSRRYFEAHGSCYWIDLLEAEKACGERYIGRTGSVDWIAAYAPQGTNEVVGILPERRSFAEVDQQDVSGIARGLSSVLKGYDELGMSTFNFALYSGPLGLEDDSVRCWLRAITRQNVYENYRTDDYFMQKLLRNEVVLVRPEMVASTMRKVFSEDRAK